MPKPSTHEKKQCQGFGGSEGCHSNKEIGQAYPGASKCASSQCQYSLQYLPHGQNGEDLDIGLLRQDMQCVREQVTETECRIFTLEVGFSPFPSQVSAAKKQISFWYQKADDPENCLRRNIIRLVCRPEKAEGQNGEFVEA